MPPEDETQRDESSPNKKYQKFMVEIRNAGKRLDKLEKQSARRLKVEERLLEAIENGILPGMEELADHLKGIREELQKNPLSKIGLQAILEEAGLL